MRNVTQNKTVLAVLILALALPLVVFAESASREETLKTLQQQVSNLQQQLQQLMSAGSAAQISASNQPLSRDNQHGTARPAVAISFGRDLYFGMRNDADVSNLQEFLTERGFYNNTITGNYFLLTRASLQKFQRAHGLRPTGYFGPLTRRIANTLLIPSGGSLSIDPRSALLKVGESVRIKGVLAPPHPACLDMVPACQIVERASYEVDASFVSDNPQVAMIGQVMYACDPLPPPSNFQPACPPLPNYWLRAVSPGIAVINATYADGQGTHTARMNVSVISASATGTIAGGITRGPLCPVEPCSAPAPDYSKFRVFVYEKSSQNLLSSVSVSRKGAYAVSSLQPKPYVVDVSDINGDVLPLDAGRSIGNAIPRTVEVIAGATTTVNFYIDTGIR